MANHTIGTVSEGTLRVPDLIYAFSMELRGIRDWRGVDYGPLLDKCLEVSWQVRNDIVEPQIEILEDLFDALEACADTGYYFGAHPGDGSDFGFWPIDDWGGDVDGD